ncbi:MAG: hypothetical protein OSJ27_01135 [Candidatus Gastranaerophilales bacterium]|nr:hypothetical protein [Candidatus Gastranaerophilales bacterium]
MRKKLLKSENKKGGKSYSITLSPVLLELIGCNLEKLDDTTIDITFDTDIKKITISDPKINNT